MAQPSKGELGSGTGPCFTSLHQVQGQRQPSLDLSDSLKSPKQLPKAYF